jgi:hypothetical protein
MRLFVMTSFIWIIRLDSFFLFFICPCTWHCKGKFQYRCKVVKTEIRLWYYWFDFPENYQLNLSNWTLVCPSSNCKSIIKGEISSPRLILDQDSNFMHVLGDFKLVDDISNGHLSANKQELVEQMSFEFSCDFSDIQSEDSHKQTNE